jgi:hypothetical protein
MLFVAAAFCAGACSAQAATLSQIDLADTTRYLGASQLFSSEIKRDENVQDNGQRGQDAFLRNAEDSATPASWNFDWGRTGSVYNWVLAYDGNIASLTLGGITRNLDITPDGTWNAVRFFLNASDASRFTTSTTDVSIETVNGAAIAPFARSSTDGIFDAAFALDNLATITSLSGTIAFSFQTKAGATGSPNGRLAVNIKALDVVPTAVPVPAALPMLGGGIAALAMIARRKRRRA